MSQVKLKTPFNNKFVELVECSSHIIDVECEIRDYAVARISNTASDLKCLLFSERSLEGDEFVSMAKVGPVDGLEIQSIGVEFNWEITDWGYSTYFTIVYSDCVTNTN